MTQQTNTQEPSVTNGNKKPSVWIYAAIVSVILVAVIWLVFMPNLQNSTENKPQQVDANDIKAPVTTSYQPETTVESTEDAFEIEPEVPISSTTIDESSTADTEAEPIIEIESAPEPVQVPPKGDVWLMSQMIEVLPKKTLVSLLKQEQLVNNFVVFVDNASRGELLTSFSPLQEPSGKFKATEDNGDQLSFTLNSESYKRYDAYAELLIALPLERSVEIYQELTESIDIAHQQLGYPAGTFDAKLVRVLDYLIKTPVISEDVKLVAPSAMYKFADEKLEKLLPVQKLLLRMGADNQTKIQTKLTEFKQALK